jgi:hypothetical protein
MTPKHHSWNNGSLRNHWPCKGLLLWATIKLLFVLCKLSKNFVKAIKAREPSVGYKHRREKDPKYMVCYIAGLLDCYMLIMSYEICQLWLLFLVNISRNNTVCCTNISEDLRFILWTERWTIYLEVVSTELDEILGLWSEC